VVLFAFQFLSGPRCGQNIKSEDCIEKCSECFEKNVFPTRLLIDFYYEFKIVLFQELYKLKVSKKRMIFSKCRDKIPRSDSFG